MFKAVLLLLTIAGPIQIEFGPFPTKEACQAWDKVQVIGVSVPLLGGESDCVEMEAPKDAPKPNDRL